MIKKGKSKVKKPVKSKLKKIAKSEAKKADKYPIFKQGYYQFSKFVLSTIVKNKNFFLKLILFAVISSIILVGIMPQGSYNTFRKVVNSSQPNKTILENINSARIILASTVETGGLATSSQEVRSVYLMLITILLWLAVVRYLRFMLSGKKLPFKQIIYSCGGPIVGLLIIIGLIALKLIPISIWIIIFSVLKTSIYFQSGTNLLMINSIMVLFSAATLYWIIPSLVALAVVTLPQTEPIKSIKIAKGLVTGQRMKIMLRLFWHLFNLVVAWLVIMVPIIVLDNFLVKKIAFLNNLPFVSIMMIIMTMLSTVWTFVYFYFIYRRLLENDPSYKK